LIRDSIEALRDFWGEKRFESWLKGCSQRATIHRICQGEFEEVGFPSLRKRLVESTKPEDIKEYLRELGSHLNQPLTLIIGGSIALILTNRLSRKTEDIDVVDEVPKEIREQHELLDRLHERFGIYVRHFQQHYLPSGWQKRVHSTETFGRIQAYLVDAIDVFLSKLTSIREKDLDDLRALKPQFDKDELVKRLKDTMGSTFASEILRQRAQHNWYVLYGEDLPQ
jgi:hypothetical protein